MSETVVAPRQCKKCGTNPASPSHPWCSPCVREAKRAKKAAKPGATSPANDEAKALYKPLLQEEWPEWAPIYLMALAGFGLPGMAENEAEVRQGTVDALREADQEFVAECRFARRFYYDCVEHSAATHKQIAGLIIALKAHRARRFVEPVIIQQHVTNNTLNLANASAPPPDVAALMERWTGQFAGDEIRAMKGEIVDADVVALPEMGVAPSAPNVRDEEA